jgi:hypothetical protein
MKKRLAKYEDLKRGSKVWDSERKCWQKVFHVYLWESILRESPNKFYINE